MADTILLAAIPLFLLLIGLEYWVDRRCGTGHYRLNDVYGSLSIGIISSKLVTLGVGAYVLQHLLPSLELSLFTDPQHQWLAWPVAFVIYDFFY